MTVHSYVTKCPGHMQPVVFTNLAAYFTKNYTMLIIISIRKFIKAYFLARIATTDEIN